MINSYTQGLLTIQWPRWHQFVIFLRFIVPIFFHILEISLMEIISSPYISLESDLPSVVFTVGISGAFLAIPCITPGSYRSNNRFIRGALDVIIQVVVVDLAVRFLVIPFCYVLHYLCIKGYVAYFVNKCLFLLYAVDGKVPVSKFVRMSKTEEGFELTRHLICYFFIFLGLYMCNFHKLIIGGIVKGNNFILHMVIPLFKELTRKKKRSRKRSYI